MSHVCEISIDIIDIFLLLLPGNSGNVILFNILYFQDDA
jgi:hypothetical protein